MKENRTRPAAFLTSSLNRPRGLLRTSELTVHSATYNRQTWSSHAMNSLMPIFSAFAVSTTAIANPTLVVEQSSAWESGYNASITIENPEDSPGLDGWSLQWSDGPSIESLWNGVRTVDGGTTTVINESWNGAIAPGASHSIGFTAAGSWPPAFPNIRLNGLPVSLTMIPDTGGGSDGNGDTPTSPCVQDLNADGDVNINDLLALMSAWGPCSNPADCAADFNANAQVDADDLMAMIGVFGPCPDGGGDIDVDGRIVAYYIEWGIYGRDYQPSDIPADKITHLNYAFANIGDDGRIAIGDPYAAIDKSYPGDSWDQPYRGTYNQINNVLKAEHPHLKTLISVGGWTWSGKFSDVALTESSRNLFAESCVDFIRTYNFDGVDIDWEYPVCCGLNGNAYRPEDRGNYTLLLEELRVQLDAASEADGREYLLTIASAGGVDKLLNYDLAGIAEQCDWVNTMSYDFMGAWDLSIAGHHSALYANPDNPSTNDNVRLHYNGAGSVQPWLDAGVEPNKLVMGVPFYGRAWGGVGNTNNGLFQSGSSVPPGTWDDWSSGATGVNDFFEIEEMLASGLYSRHWDDQAKVPWLYSVSQHGGHFVSYDDAESMQYKIDYVQDLNLGGVMFWEITGDRNETLLNVIYEGLVVP